MTSLYLSSNQLSGPIPPEIGNLTSLTYLYLSSNQLSGPIPPEIGNLTSLTSLYLYSNQLSGPIPPEIGNLTSLTYLYLSSNQLSGPIPAGVFGSFSAIQYLYLHDNSFAQTAIDEVLSQVFQARAAYTYASPVLRVDLNASPSGSLTDPAVTPGAAASNADWSWNGGCHEPLTGLAMVWALRNDNCGEGFNSWSVTY